MRFLFLTSISVLFLPVTGCQTIAGQKISDEKARFVIETIPAKYKTQTLTAFVKTPMTEFVDWPHSFETVTESVVVVPEREDYEVIPGTYEWVDGEISGQSTIYEIIPERLETFEEIDVTQPALTEIIETPPVCERQQNGELIIVAPQSFMEKILPQIEKPTEGLRLVAPAKVSKKLVTNEIRNGRTRIMVKEPTLITKIIPALTREVERKVIKVAGGPRERVIPAGVREITCRFVEKPEYYLVRDTTGEIIQKLESADALAEFQSANARLIKE